MNKFTKNSLSLLVVTILTIGISFAQTSNTENKKTIQIKVMGMTCAGCSNHVSDVLKDTPGVLENSVAYPGNIAEIIYDADQVSPAIIAQVIEDKTSYKTEIMNSETKKNLN